MVNNNGNNGNMEDKRACLQYFVLDNRLHCDKKNKTMK